MKSAEWEGRGKRRGRDKVVKELAIKCRKMVWVNRVLGTCLQTLLFPSMSVCAHTRRRGHPPYAKKVIIRAKLSAQFWMMTVCKVSGMPPPSSPK